jgi:DNA-directed RNA polymerase subunit omega
MMTKPGITELDKCVDSRYTLVSMVAKRARMIGIERLPKDTDNPDEEYNPNLDKPVTQAVNEIADGVVGYVRSEAIEKAKEYEEEKFEAISQLERAAAELTAETGYIEDAEEEDEESEHGENSRMHEISDEEETGDMSLLDRALADALAAHKNDSEFNGGF